MQLRGPALQYMCNSNKERKLWEGYSDHELKQSDVVSLLQVNFFPKQLTSGQVCFTASRVSASLNFQIRGLSAVYCSSLACIDGFLLSLQKIDVNTELGNGKEFLLAPLVSAQTQKLVTQPACLTPVAGVRQWEYFPLPAFPTVMLHIRIYLKKLQSAVGQKREQKKQK